MESAECLNPRDSCKKGGGEGAREGENARINCSPLSAFSFHSLPLPLCFPFHFFPPRRAQVPVRGGGLAGPVRPPLLLLPRLHHSPVSSLLLVHRLLPKLPPSFHSLCQSRIFLSPLFPLCLPPQSSTLPSLSSYSFPPSLPIPPSLLPAAWTSGGPGFKARGKATRLPPPPLPPSTNPCSDSSPPPSARARASLSPSLLLLSPSPPP